MRSIWKKLACSACAAVVALAAAGSAHAAILFMSAFSSDQTPANVLDATFEFIVVGNNMTLTVTNTTTLPNEFLMNELYFNVTSNVSSLTVDNIPGGWTLDPNMPADGFGVFDFALMDDLKGNNNSMIEAGQSLAFSFTFTGTATDLDFVTAFSTIPPGDTPMIAAAKWVRGSNMDDSAFGAVPAPGTALLLLVPMLGARRRRS